jgi:hypothetical protein
LSHAQLVLAGLDLVVDEGGRQLGLALVAGGHFDGSLPLGVLRALRAGLEPGDVSQKRVGLGDHLLEGLL